MSRQKNYRNVSFPRISQYVQSCFPPGKSQSVQTNDISSVSNSCFAAETLVALIVGKFFEPKHICNPFRVAISSSTNKFYFMFLLHNIPLNHFLSHTYCKCKHPPNSEYIIHIKILVFFRLQNAPQFHSLCIFLK